MTINIFSDVHSNFTALEAIIADWQHRGDGATARWVCLGDLVGYGPAEQVVQVLQWLKTQPNGTWIPGNHDEYMLDSSQIGDVSLPARVTLNQQQQLLQRANHSHLGDWFLAEMKQKLNTGTDFLVKKHAAAQQPSTVFFSHASVASNFRRLRYLKPWNREMLLQEYRDLTALPAFQSARQAGHAICCFHGHTHFAACVQILQENDMVKYLPVNDGSHISMASGQIYFVNPGSVGQPRDGDARAAYVVFTPDTASLTFHRVAYEHQIPIRSLRRESNKVFQAEEKKAYQQLAEQLETGWGGDTPAYHSVYPDHSKEK